MGEQSLHLRAEEEGDVSELRQNTRFATDGSGTALTHLVSLSGGTGTETHVAHVYDNVPLERLVLVAPTGEAAITIDLIWWLDVRAGRDA